jgi:4-amino-4-deoxy-L-arabinose transferase-like glycosyltransferase
MGRERRSGWLLGGVVLYLLAWGLRMAVLFSHRLHPDEALYGHWGLLILSGRDPWLATVPVYKPPLHPYILFTTLSLAGSTELAVRLPGLLAGILTVGLTGRLAVRLYRTRLAGVMAMAVVALSPFTILFSASGFTDPVMVALGLGACVAAAEGGAGMAGLLAGLSFATKQTGVVWLPLMGCVLLVGQVRRLGAVDGWALARSAGGFLAVVAAVAAWDGVRVARGAQSFWSLGVGGYGGLRMIWPQELGIRLHAWRTWLRHLLGSPMLDILLLGGVGGLVVRALRRPEGGNPTWGMVYDLLLAAFCGLYLLVHWLWAFPVWDRYLLPLVPLVAVLVGRVLALLLRRVRVRRSPSWRRGATVVLLLLLLTGLAAPAVRAATGHIPVGAGLAGYDGLEQVVAFLRHLPPGTVLYHHWLGWEYAFYLFDAPLYLAYWPTPAWLAQDVAVFGAAEPRYVVFPAWESRERASAALAEVGYSLEPVLEVEGAGGGFTVYRIARYELSSDKRSPAYPNRRLGRHEPMLVAYRNHVLARRSGRWGGVCG